VPRIHAASGKILQYLTKLEAQSSRRMTVWPEHCNIGTWGHNIFAPVMNEINAWQRFHLQPCKFVLKGTNMWTEHYGVLQAEVPDFLDRDTTFNSNLWSSLVSADKIFIAGEAGVECFPTRGSSEWRKIGDFHRSSFIEEKGRFKRPFLSTTV
jgi:nicotinamidase/pyrazinamidase